MAFLNKAIPVVGSKVTKVDTCWEEGRSPYGACTITFDNGEFITFSLYRGKETNKEDTCTQDKE